MKKLEIKELNNKYNDFQKINNLRYWVYANNKGQFSNFNVKNEISNAIKINKYNLKTELGKTLNNRIKYKQYLEDYEKLIKNINLAYDNKELNLIDRFFFLIVCNLLKKRPQCNFKLQIISSYDTPKRRNHYERRYIYTYDEIFRIMEEYYEEKNKIFRSSLKKEEQINLSSKCLYCDHLIKSTDNYCSNCGNIVNCNDNSFSDHGINKKYSKYKFNTSSIKKILTKDSKNLEILKLMNCLIKYYEIRKISCPIFSPFDEIDFFDNKLKEEKSVIVKKEIKKEIKELFVDNKIRDKQNNDYEKIMLKEELDYINKSNLVMYNKIGKIKLDNGNYMSEKFSSYISSVSTKSKNYHSKTEKILENYFKKKYLNKEIYNYKIIDVYADWFPSTVHIVKIKYVFFSCKCKKCGRVMKQVSDDFFCHPIKCKCNFEKKLEQEKADLKLEKSNISYMKRIYEAFSLDDSQNRKDYYDIYMSDYFTFYYKYNGELKRIGFIEITNFNAERNYIIGNVKISFNNTYTVFYNVYYYLGIAYKYGYKFTHEENKYLNPILYCYTKEGAYEVNTILENKYILKNEIISYIFIYFERTDSLLDERKNKYKMNVYCGDKIIFQKEDITQINHIYNLDENSIIFSFNIKNKSSSNYQFFINEKRIENYDDNINYLNSDFYRTNTNINININNIADPVLKSNIQKYHKFDNEKYRKVYIHKTADKSGWVLFEYLKEFSNFEVLQNEFEDDKNLNYCILIDRNDKEKNDFVNYVLLNSKDHHSYEFNIYEHSLNSLCNILLEKQENADKVIDSIKKDYILEIEHKEKKEYILKRLMNPPFGYRDYNNNPQLIQSSYYREIIKKLKNKYHVDDFGLILILLIKYGEEVVFNFSTYYFDSSNNEEKNAILYDKLLNKSNFKRNHWKSEYNLFLLIKCYFTDAIFQYKFKGLGAQSLDVYIPSLRIGIEYQGKQHYEVVDYFGGEEKLKIQQQCDNKKREICLKNNIILIEWNYKDKVNKINLDNYLFDYKEKLQEKYKFTNIH